ncbi:hypothetical protein DE146DRAFT_9960 [Phaeosphaeria sp. MPI-PUGE-AT-0046c]|nr:hypothetical protein DE146DRAFT_9960 [Phaeosphaeria sp. MPI-PUGE-AT-0046c]
MHEDVALSVGHRVYFTLQRQLDPHLVYFVLALDNPIYWGVSLLLDVYVVESAYVVLRFTRRSFERPQLVPTLYKYVRRNCCSTDTISTRDLDVSDTNPFCHSSADIEKTTSKCRASAGLKKVMKRDLMMLGDGSSYRLLNILLQIRECIHVTRSG